ncbi:hypothetical protein JTB14_016224 [Gonioctena quinquepunctata]|nr:hypothetical protein JTB14_016224 [Gonioctena quinquepunctata]
MSPLGYIVLRSNKTPQSTILNWGDWEQNRHSLIPKTRVICYKNCFRFEEFAGAGQSSWAVFCSALGKYTTVFQNEVFAIFACAYENIN